MIIINRERKIVQCIIISVNNKYKNLSHKSYIILVKSYMIPTFGGDLQLFSVIFGFGL